jgi:hypothetical protein
MPARTGAIAQARRHIKHVPHLLRIVVPIGGEVQASVPGQFTNQQCGKSWTHQTALVVAFLMPRIGEVNADFIEAGIGHFMLQHLDRVVMIKANVVDVVISKCVEQATDTGRVHFDPDIVAGRIMLRSMT